MKPFPRELFRKWGSLGLLGVRYPEEDGGSGMDKIAGIIREEFSRVCQAFASAWSAHSHLGIWPIWRCGTPAQKERFFRPALAEKFRVFGLVSRWWFKYPCDEDPGAAGRRWLAAEWQQALHHELMIADFLLVAARTDPALRLSPSACSSSSCPTRAW